MHLILLVGTNPVPNYVAAMYAANHGVTHHYLVHTIESGSQQTTEEIAKALRRQLIARAVPEGAIRLVPLQDASNNEIIYSDLKTGLSSIPTHAEIILNYTGGTKAMAVHTYSWLQHNRPDKDRVVFQYLDARKHRIVTDSRRHPETGDLRNDPAVDMGSIGTMLRLHGYEPEPRSMGEDPHPTITRKLGELIKDNRIETFFEMTRRLRNIYYDTKGICIQTKKLLAQLERHTAQAAKSELEELLKSNPFLKKILWSFPDNSRILNEDGTLWTPIASSSNSEVKSRTQGCIHGYLDGKWLEFHVMRAIDDIAGRRGLVAGKHFGNSIEAHKAVGSRRFELDLFVLRGYQLTGISVTTAEQSKAKSKAFEVMHRARQIGGDEARGILVANLSRDGKVDQVVEMEADINFLLTGSTSEYLKVIGREDWELERLKDRLEGILWN